MIPYGRQKIDQDDIDAVVAALKSDFITTGPLVPEFEKAFAKKVGARHATAVSSGTAALHVACLAAGFKPGIHFATSAMTFVASANCGLYCGWRPTLVDITGNGLMDPGDLERRIRKDTRAFIPVHYGGMTCDMESIQRIAGDDLAIEIIEDACHALGAMYNGYPVGSCHYSNMSCFSFHPVKHVTTGEGGMITTNSDELDVLLKVYRSHGIFKDEKYIGPHDPWYYEIHGLGFNYRMTDFQAALGISQLKKLDSFVKRRRAIASMYDDAFNSNQNFSTIAPPARCVPAYHLYPILLSKGHFSRKREIFDKLKAVGIGVQVHYIPIHYQPYYTRLGFKDGNYPRAEQFYQAELSIPIHPSMSDVDVETVIEKVREIIR